MEFHYIFSKSLRMASPIFSRLFCRSVQGFASFCTRLISSTKISAGQDDSTVSYLISSCGLSPEAAIVASHKVKLQSSEKPNSVLALLRHYEFSDTHISTLVRKHPHILVADAKKTLVPKLEFFCSIGLSRLDLARTLTYNPLILSRSLKNHILPTYSFVKRVVLSGVTALFILKNRSTIFMENLSKNVLPNIGFVNELGMPQSRVALLLKSYTNTVMRKPELFSQLVGEVKEMGFDPQKTSFVEALHALYGKETTLKRCQEAYRRWSWSENHIRSAFRLCPLCMVMSENKIMGIMDFLVNKMGWHSQKIAKYPNVCVAWRRESSQGARKD